ncbi:hypothetical protein MRB53_001864 [Persea americana]|uniref:Uncharacterized protein n=1 Tax=Persea americana TaxID=3435 RepID=A0ACC2MT35_PERAE|nr:hypothetical protein MRB53_001864 [Persea americana]
MSLFSVTANQLNGRLPPDLGIRLSHLIQFFAARNQFTGPIPVSLSNASGLQELALSSNQFSGSIPTNLGKLGGLQFLNLENNLLGSGEAEDMDSLSSLTNCSLLNKLSISENRLTGALPNSIANLSTNLDMLYLGKNQMFGSIPSGVGNLFKLIILSLSFNSFTGMIPEGIGKLKQLQVLNLRENRFSGEIPAFIGNNTQLSYLLLAKNNLQGSIPSSLENCHRLQQLNLAYNHLHGYITKQVFSIATLQILNLRANSLFGSLPTEVGNLKSLGTLIISDNKLSGEIPRSVDNCLSLENLYIESNFFQGTFPPLSSLKGMLEMDISCNNFSGQIPEYLQKLRYLKYLNLSYNNFEGEVLQEGIFKIASAVSVIGNRELCGGSPALLLHTCPSQDSKEERRHFSPRAIIAIIVGSVLCLCFLFSLLYFYMRKSKKHSHSDPITDPLEEQLLNISYRDLCKGTDSFSSANLIGIGSYGHVYKTFLDCIGTIVAVKVLNLQHPGASKSFIAECRALRNVRHRNLLKALSVCSSIDSKGDDFKALVFEYMGNGNLDQWLHPDKHEQHQSKNLSLIQMLNIAVDVASALNYLHNSCKKPIVHCDLKPSNVLLDDNMIAHVGDFGLVRFLFEATNNCSQNHTNSSGIRDTIGYVAPKYGMGNKVSTSGDVYSYGIILLEMFTGKKPTDEMFHGSLNLHQFAKLALPERVVEIVNQSLLSIEVEGLGEKQTHTYPKSTLEMCLISTIKVGVACSMISMKDRMAIGDVLVEMKGIRDLYLGVGNIHDSNN